MSTKLEEEASWREAEGSQKDLPDGREPGRGRYTLHRVANLIMIVLYFAAMVCHIVCLSVLVAKRNELKSKLGDTYDKCILYLDNREVGNTGTFYITNSRSHTCEFAVYGSVALATLSLFMMVFVGIRTVMFKKMNALGLSDVIGSAVAILGAFSIAVVVSIGRAVTCDHLTNDLDGLKCSDVYIDRGPDNPDPKVAIYGTMKNAETSSWVAFLFLMAVGVLSVSRTVLWCKRRRTQAANFNKLLDENPPTI